MRVRFPRSGRRRRWIIHGPTYRQAESGWVNGRIYREDSTANGCGEVGGFSWWNSMGNAMQWFLDLCGKTILRILFYEKLSVPFKIWKNRNNEMKNSCVMSGWVLYGYIGLVGDGLYDIQPLTEATHPFGCRRNGPIRKSLAGCRRVIDRVRGTQPVVTHGLWIASISA